MLSLQGMYGEAQAEAGDISAATLVVLKRGINQGIFKLRQAMKREYAMDRRTFALVADQQFYQLPEAAIRPKSITVTVAGTAYPLIEITSELEWRVLNSTVYTAAIPTHYYARGSDEVGIYPVPASNLAVVAGTSGAEVTYQARHHQLTADDYTTGTVTLTANSATVTGSGTTFTALMVGRSLQIADSGSPDNLWYKISAYTSATVVTLENVFAGTTGAGKTYTIGEVPDIPEEVHYAPVDYALHRFYLRRRDADQAKYYKRLFDEAVATARSDYGRKSTSSIINAIDPNNAPNRLFRRNISIDV